MDTKRPTALTCERMAPLVDDFVDDRLDPAAREQLDSHLAGCESCRRMADDLREIRRGTRALPTHAPRPEVWARIAGQLAAQTPARSRTFWTGARVAMAMAAVMVLSVVTSVVVLRGPRPETQPTTPAQTAPAQTAAAAVHPSAPATVKDVDEHLRIADANYQQAITGLEKIVTSEQAALDPAVAATLQKNMGIIDQAIRESRAAIKSQPTSQLAQTSLFDALRQKVALLEDTIALINVMRKGDQAGAAKIIGGLSKS
ncbi:MAG: zf-HC2 domain-containing protein [Acidobacteria bacterium]|nr:zf-HC2 domain-containing protein [Acidobacteriota bacterium]